jgi:cytidylate kinase
VSHGRPCIAIDGPVAAGKSTIARMVAAKLGFTYIDSGAMYRALAWAAIERKTEAANAAEVVALLDRLRIELVPQSEGANLVLVDDGDVTGKIRTQQIGELASKLSEIPAVRKRMVALQQEMARGGGVVMEGRDIQTVVLPEAEVKIFLTAPAEERAERRCLELKQRGYAANYDEVLAEIQGRDRRDMTREHSPLRAAPEAVHVDTGGLTIEQVVERVLEAVRGGVR